MRIVSSTGYGFTGSTAITDLIREYDHVETCKYSGYELKFFHDSKGILNLHHYMVVNRTPAAMNEAAEDYLNKCRGWAASGSSMNYELFFNNRFMEYTAQYMEELGGDVFMKTYDLSKLTGLESLISKAINKVHAVWHSLTYKEEYGQKHLRPIPLFAKEGKNCLYDLTDDDFLRITKAYFSRLMNAYCSQEIANIHELIPISLIDQCGRYFDDLYIITTERDPRDIYLNAKYRWLTLNHPSKDVHFFCNHYRWLRSMIPETKKKEVIKVQFEDLIYHYDETTGRIEGFLGLDAAAHIKKKQFFIPEKARLNCNLCDVYPEEKENLRIIENELSEWLFDFQSI